MHMVLVKLSSRVEEPPLLFVTLVSNVSSSNVILDSRSQSISAGLVRLRGADAKPRTHEEVLEILWNAPSEWRVSFDLAFWDIKSFKFRKEAAGMESIRQFAPPGFGLLAYPAGNPTAISADAFLLGNPFAVKGVLVRALMVWWREVSHCRLRL